MSEVIPEHVLKYAEKVHGHIEECIEKYKNKNKVIQILYQKHNVHPDITKKIWEVLEEVNPQFFQAYHVRLLLKDQIKQFKHLVIKQGALLQQMNHPHEVLVPNGSHILAMNDDNNASYCYVPETNGINNNAMMTDNMHHLTNGGGFINGYEPIIQWEMQRTPHPLQPHPMNMVSGYNLDNPEFVYGGGMESHMPVSSYGIMDSLPHSLMEDDDTHLSHLLLQVSHDLSNTFPLETYFPAVTDDDDMLGAYDNYGYHSFERDS